MQLLFNGAPETQHVSAVVGDLEGSESIARIGQFSMHGHLPAYELCVQRVGIIRADVGVPASPFVARRIRLWMDLGCDGLEEKHGSVAYQDGPEVVSVSVTTTLTKNVEPQLGLIERKRRAQVVDDKRGSRTLQHSEAAEDPKIAYVERLVQELEYKDPMNPTERIDQLIESLHDWRGKTLATVRKTILEADRKIIEEWKWMGSPVWSRDGMIAVGNAHKDKVKLTFSNGANLPDPDKLFNAGLGGNKWRAIDLFDGDKINARALKNLVRAAIDYNQLKLKSKAPARTQAKAHKSKKS